MTLGRTERLEADRTALEGLRQASTILDWESSGQPPDRYTLSFRGRGIAKASGDKIQWLELHRCQLRLPYSYPERPPDLRWITPLFHPNVSFGGFLSVRDLGIEWSESMSLTAVCERLWDVARMEYRDLEHPANFAARDWLRQQDDLPLPVDPRPLRDRFLTNASNVVRYERRNRGVALSPPQSGEVLFIGEDTPEPTIPTSLPGENEDRDILFIE